MIVPALMRRIMMRAFYVAPGIVALAGAAIGTRAAPSLRRAAHDLHQLLRVLIRG